MGIIRTHSASLVAQMIKNPPARDLGFIPGLGRSPGEDNRDPLQYSCLENSILAGYSPWGHKELDMSEQLSLSAICVGWELQNGNRENN